MASSLLLLLSLLLLSLLLLLLLPLLLLEILRTLLFFAGAFLAGGSSLLFSKELASLVLPAGCARLRLLRTRCCQ
jgi:hypothetical protein